MKCAICRNGYTKPGTTTVVLEKDQTTLIFKVVPSEICENCGEEYVSSETNQKILNRANDALQRNVSLEMQDFAA